MAAFNLTAQINLRGPSNLKPTVSKIKRELESVKTNLDININPTSIKTLTSIISKLKALSKSSLDANGNVLTLTSSLNQLASGFTNLASTTSASVGGINSATKAVSSINKPLSQATSQIEEFGKQSGLAIRRFAAFSSVTGVIYTLLGAFTSAYSEFIDFNKEMVRLSQVTGKSVGDLKGLSDEITRLSTGLGVSSSDLIQVSATLAQAGLSAEDTKVALEALAKSTLAPSFDNIASTAEGAIAAIRQFGIQSGELESALGSINSVAAAFAVESSDIITAIQRTGGVFASSSRGVSEGTDALNEFIAVFTSIRATTRESAESIATGLRTIFTRIQRGQTIEALKEFGINLTDLEGKFVGPYEASRRLAAGLKDLDPRDLRFSQIAEELGGFRQIGKVIPLIQQMAVSEEALKVAQKGQSSIAKDTAIAQGSLSNQFNKTRESFVALVRDIGDSSSFKAFVGVSLTLTNSFISLARSLKPLLPLLLTFTAIKMGSGLNQFIGGFRSGLGGGNAGAGGAGGGPMGGGPTTGTSGGGATSATGAISANTVVLGTTSQALATLNQSIQTLNTNIIISNGLYQTTGKPPGFARGGVVPGSGRGDTFPAMLEPGEFVIRKDAVQTLGSDNLHRMNKSGGGRIKKFAAGGKIIVDHAEKSPDAEEEKKIIGQHIANSVNDLTNWYSQGNPIAKKGTANSTSVQTMGQYKSMVGIIAEAGIKQSDSGIIKGDSEAFDLPFGFTGEGGAGELFNTIGNRTNLPIDIKKSNDPSHLKDSMLSKITNWYNKQSARSPIDALYKAGNLEVGAAIYSPGTDSSIPFSLNLDRKDPKVEEKRQTDSLPARTRTAKAQKKWQGGEIQKFSIGGTAKEIDALLRGSTIPDEDKYGEFRNKQVEQGLLRKVIRQDYSSSMTPDKAAAYGATRDLLQEKYNTNEKIKAARLEKRIAASTQLGLVGLFPIGHNKTKGPFDINGRDVVIHERGLGSEFEEQIRKMQAGSAAQARKFAAGLQRQATLGGLEDGQKKVFDFDETLVKGADIFDANGKIDIPGYSDDKRVKAALQKGKLTALGVGLRKLLKTNPDILSNFRLLTARPQSNAASLSARLSELGLNIPVTKIKGMNGGDKSKDLAADETLVDDNVNTINNVRKAGKAGIEYSRVQKGLSKKVSIATGQANIEGAFIEQAMALIGAPILPDAIATRAIDYPNGLGAAASYFPGIGRDWPTEVKRTIDSDSRSKAKEEFTKYLFPSQVPVAKRLGGLIQEFAMGGGTSDRVPALLTPGEFVINKKAAQNIGASRLNRMNRADKVQGFARGGSVGGVQRFAEGGGALDRIGGGYGAVGAITTVILPSIFKLAESFGKLEGSAAVLGTGFEGAAREAASFAVSTGVAMNTIGGFSNKFKMGAIGSAALAGGISGAITDASAKALEQALKKTTESFGKFDKIFSDISNAPTEKLKAEASMKLEKSFVELNSIVKDTSASLDLSENLNSFGKLMGDLSQSVLTGIVGFHALKTVMDAQKTAALATIAAHKAATYSTVMTGLAGGPSTPIPPVGMMATKLAAGFGALIPWVGVLIVAFGAVSQVVAFFNSSLKKSAEQMDRLNKALFETTKNSQDVSLANERYITKILPKFSEVERKNISPEAKAQEIGKVGIDNELNLMFRTLLRANLADVGMVTGPDVSMQDMQGIYDKGNTKGVFREIVKASEESFKDSQFIAAKTKVGGMDTDQAQRALIQAKNYGTRDTVVAEYTGGLSRGIMAQSEATLALRKFKVNLLNLDNVLVGLNARFDNVLTTSMNKFKDLDISLALLKGEPMQIGGDMVRRDIEKLTNIQATPKEDLTRIYKSVGSMMGGADQPIFKDMVDQMEGIRLIQTELPIVLQKINSRPQGLAGAENMTDILMAELGPTLAAAIGGKDKDAAMATARIILGEIGAGVNTKLAGTTEASTLIELVKNNSALNEVLRNGADVHKLFLAALEINAKILDQVGEKNKVFLDLQNNLIQNSIQRKGIEIQTNLEMKKALGNRISLSDMTETFDSQIKTLTAGAGKIGPSGTTNVDTIISERSAAKTNVIMIEDALRTENLGVKRRIELNEQLKKETGIVTVLTQTLKLLSTATDKTKLAFEKIAEAQNLFNNQRQGLNTLIDKSDTPEGSFELSKVLSSFEAVQSGKLLPGEAGRDQASLVLQYAPSLKDYGSTEAQVQALMTKATKSKVDTFLPKSFADSIIKGIVSFKLDQGPDIKNPTDVIKTEQAVGDKAMAVINKELEDGMKSVTDTTVKIFKSFNKQMEEQLAESVNNVKRIGDRAGPVSPTLPKTGLKDMTARQSVMEFTTKLESQLLRERAPYGEFGVDSELTFNKRATDTAPPDLQFKMLLEGVRDLVPGPFRTQMQNDLSPFRPKGNREFIDSKGNLPVPKRPPTPSNINPDQSSIPAATTDKLATIYKAHDENTNLLVTSMNSFTTVVPNLIASLKEFAGKFEKGMKGTVTTTGEMSVNFNNSLDLRGAPADISPKALLLIQSVVKDEVKRGLNDV